MLELLDLTDKGGVTALMRAADRGDAKAVRLLVKHEGGMRDDDD